MPGIGKTTLASKIYQDKRILDEFPIRIWLDVLRSQNSRLNIIKQFIKQRMSRYLLVMDGVWDANSLNEFIAMLPGMGKVLITSRENHITRKPHVLRFLNEKESWELLQLEVFGKLDECPEMLRSIGERIARNCDGSPFAIAAIGSSLVVDSSTEAAMDLTEKLWKAVSENVTSYVTNYGQQHNLFSSIELSYIRLPQHLQTCFLYLGVFPEGHEICVQTLTRLWIAERFVSDNTELKMEERAKGYLEDLINRNLVVVGKSYPNGQIRTCRLHKLIYGFCKNKAVEQEFYQQIKKPRDRPVSLGPTCHRLCIYSHLSGFLSSKPKGRRIRSVLCFNDEDKALHSEHSSTMHKCFKFLRVLECKYAKFSKFPNKLNRLMLLRYISLSCDDLDVIPEAISSLLNLETLVVYTQSPSIQLKANIWRMIHLRHVVTKAAIVLAIRGEGEAGENLQTLARLAPVCCTEDVLKRTPNLKILGIRGDLADLSDPNTLKILEHLEKLKLINEPAKEIQLDLHCFPSTLKRLTLSGTNLKWECMSILGKIDGLEILKLKNKAFIGESWTSTDEDGFGRLGFLLIATTDLVSWEAEPDCFPRLKCLLLKNCGKLQKVPLALAKTLDTMNVDNVPASAVDSAREIEGEMARRGKNKAKGKLSVLEI